MPNHDADCALLKLRKLYWKNQVNFGCKIYLKNHLNWKIFGPLLGLTPDFYNLTYSKVNQKVSIKSIKANALIDMGSTLSHLSIRFSKLLNGDFEKL